LDECSQHAFTLAEIRGERNGKGVNIFARYYCANFSRCIFGISAEVIVTERFVRIFYGKLLCDNVRANLRAGRIEAAAARFLPCILLWPVRMKWICVFNCRHIVNATIQERLRKLVEAAGFKLPVICTPEELLENENEQNY
jgi:hypothetical protein